MHSARRALKRGSLRRPPGACLCSSHAAHFSAISLTTRQLTQHPAISLSAMCHAAPRRERPRRSAHRRHACRFFPLVEGEVPECHTHSQGASQGSREQRVGGRAPPRWSATVRPYASHAPAPGKRRIQVTLQQTVVVYVVPSWSPCTLSALLLSGP